MVSSILPINELKSWTWILWYLKSNCFCSFFLEELKTPKRHFEIDWPLAIEFRKWFFYLNLAKWRLILLKVKGPGPSVRHPLDSEKCDNFQLQFFLILGNFNFTVLFLLDKISENVLFDVLANHMKKNMFIWVPEYRNKHSRTLITFLTFFQGLRPYSGLHSIR